MPKAAVSLNASEKLREGLTSNKPIEEDPDAEMPEYGKDNGLTLQMLRGKSYDDPMWDELLDQMTYEDQSYLITNGQMATVVLASVSKPDTKEGDGPTGYSGSQGGLSFPFPRKAGHLAECRLFAVGGIKHVPLGLGRAQRRQHQLSSE